MTMVYVYQLKDREAQVREALFDLQESQREKELINKQRGEDAYKRALDIYNAETLGQNNFNTSEIDLAYLSIETATSFNYIIDESLLLKAKLLLLKSQYTDSIETFRIAGASSYVDALKPITTSKNPSIVRIFESVKKLDDKRLVMLFIAKKTFAGLNISSYYLSDWVPWFLSLTEM